MNLQGDRAQKVIFESLVVILKHVEMISATVLVPADFFRLSPHIRFSVSDTHRSGARLIPASLSLLCLELLVAFS